MVYYLQLARVLNWKGCSLLYFLYFIKFIAQLMLELHSLTNRNFPVMTSDSPKGLSMLLGLCTWKFILDYMAITIKICGQIITKLCILWFLWTSYQNSTEITKIVSYKFPSAISSTEFDKMKSWNEKNWSIMKVDYRKLQLYTYTPCKYAGIMAMRENC